MTVGSQVKSCLASINGAQATLQLLTNKADTKDAKEAFIQAEQMIAEIKADIQQQVRFISREEPQYKK